MEADTLLCTCARLSGGSVSPEFEQVVAHGLAFSYWLLRIATDKKRIDMRFKEE